MKKGLFIYGVSAVMLAILGILGFEFAQIHNLKSQIDDLNWNSEVRAISNRDNSIEPSVGTIQFLERGYSIQLSKVNYGADGLRLEGFVGNPLELTITNLTLNFSVTKPLYTYRDEYFKEKREGIWFGLEPIGKAQSTPIANLTFGGREPFDVTIPNVKQTQEGIRIVVSFSGEQYSYPLSAK